ncbi:sulfatase-like hydrolase/transferase [Polaribacter vadi]|uniref:sulfatase-like hydrolase/transferase n=1 Tax=Polaribacter TaxID=52959 RepID=UPI001C0A0371|nr:MULTISPECIES: sulfatase-like hydrolase/transferase [Polaribacter]MBU3011898.1 sulfatase-like hydrolase/transferase [Polaribacter vadi]MDO6741712.1 sulfatase-like hydrolase/transferase [Polaribacter sp. 1_MG-2023]
MRVSLIISLLLSILLFNCSSPSENRDNEVDDIDTPVNASKPNILLVIADDVSKDAIPNYSEGISKANMPNLQSLMNSGITFDNVWSYAVCSPTRASIITGKYGNNTGVIEVGDQISTSETSIQKYISNNTNAAYASAIFGKWHISIDTNDAETMGVDYFAGIKSGGVQDYYSWPLIEDGVSATNTDYMTTKLTDLAIDWKAAQTKPWFLWMAYTAPHTPFHLAPNNLHSQGNLSTDQTTIDANPLPYYLSALEALDTEMGRLINSMSDEEKANTIIIFIGDNGTPGQVVQSPYGRRTAKGSLYQGGVNVPMIISGLGVNRMGVRETALINSTDLYTTIGNITGVSTSELHNSKSFYDLFTDANATKREYVYSEKEDAYTIRNATYKYIKYDDGTEELYNLATDAYESSNLINSTLSTDETNAKTALIAEATKIRN